MNFEKDPRDRSWYQSHFDELDACDPFAMEAERIRESQLEKPTAEKNVLFRMMHFKQDGIPKTITFEAEKEGITYTCSSESIVSSLGTSMSSIASMHMPMPMHTSDSQFDQSIGIEPNSNQEGHKGGRRGQHSGTSTQARKVDQRSPLRRDMSMRSIQSIQSANSGNLQKQIKYIDLPRAGSRSPVRTERVRLRHGSSPISKGRLKDSETSTRQKSNYMDNPAVLDSRRQLLSKSQSCRQLQAPEKKNSPHSPTRSRHDSTLISKGLLKDSEISTREKNIDDGSESHGQMRRRNDGSESHEKILQKQTKYIDHPRESSKKSKKNRTSLSPPRSRHDSSLISKGLLKDSETSTEQKNIDDGLESHGLMRRRNDGSESHGKIIKKQTKSSKKNRSSLSPPRPRHDSNLINGDRKTDLRVKESNYMDNKESNYMDNPAVLDSRREFLSKSQSCRHFQTSEKKNSPLSPARSRHDSSLISKGRLKDSETSTRQKNSDNLQKQTKYIDLPRESSKTSKKNRSLSPVRLRHESILVNGDRKTELKESDYMDTLFAVSNYPAAPNPRKQFLSKSQSCRHFKTSERKPYGRQLSAKYIDSLFETSCPELESAPSISSSLQKVDCREK
jgi:hypothetical protein